MQEASKDDTKVVVAKLELLSSRQVVEMSLAWVLAFFLLLIMLLLTLGIPMSSPSSIPFIQCTKTQVAAILFSLSFLIAISIPKTSGMFGGALWASFTGAAVISIIANFSSDSLRPGTTAFLILGSLLTGGIVGVAQRTTWYETEINKLDLSPSK